MFYLSCFKPICSLMKYIVVLAAICFMLEDWRGMDKEKVKEYIINCQVCIASALLFLAVFFLAFILDSCKL